MNPYPDYELRNTITDWATWATIVITSGRFFVEKKQLELDRIQIRELRKKADELDAILGLKLSALNKATNI